MKQPLLQWLQLADFPHQSMAYKLLQYPLLLEDPRGDMRIKIKLEMIGEKGAEVWARYAQPYASKEAGIQFMPEIGDEGCCQAF